VARMGDRRFAYWVWTGSAEGRRLIGRLRHRWGDNIKMDLRDVGWGHGLD